METANLSRYPNELTDEQLRQLEDAEIARRRDEAVGEMGRVATLFSTGGMIEASSYKHERPATLEVSEPTQRSFGAAALNAEFITEQLNQEILTPKNIAELEDALRHQESIEAARREALALAQ